MAEADSPHDDRDLAAGASRALRSVLSAAIFGTVAVVFTVSFATIIYGNVPTPGRGIGLALAGAAVVAILGALRLTYRDTVVQPQDATAIVLSLAVASIVSGWEGSPDALLATVVALVATSTALAGLFAYLAGRFRLGFLVRFIPYPVIGGFLAATGFLITLGAIGIALRQNLTLWTLPTAFEPASLVRWLPWLLFGGALVAIMRRFRHDMILPVCILLAVAGFYLVLLAGGGSIASARADGLLLGPFESSGFLEGVGPSLLAAADWRAVLAHTPTMVAAVGMALIGTMLNATALGIATGREIDADRDLRGVGVANLAVAPFGGMISYHVVSETIFARTLGLRGTLPGLTVAAFALATLFFGAGLLSVLPIGVLAGVVAFLGIDLLDTWLRVERRRLPLRDFAIVLLILAVAATVGFLQAIAVGLLAAVVLFVIAYSGVDVVRLRTSAAHLRSRVERPPHELRLLAAEGERASVHQLAGYLFFGTASRLLGELRGGTDRAPPGPRCRVLDFARVTGIDASAAFALARFCRDDAAEGAEVVLSGASPALRTELARAGLAPGGPGVTVVGRLDDALRLVEERLLADTPTPATGTPRNLLDELARLHPDFDPAAHFRPGTAAAGDEVLSQGAEPDGMILLVSGSLRAEFVAPDGKSTPVATIRPGTLVGEIGHYARVRRTARVVAETGCSLLHMTDNALARLEAENPRLAADFHRLASADLARRLMRTSALLRDADV